MKKLISPSLNLFHEKINTGEVPARAEGSGSGGYQPVLNPNFILRSTN
jgi:hypothetical protein